MIDWNGLDYFGQNLNGLDKNGLNWTRMGKTGLVRTEHEIWWPQPINWPGLDYLDWIWTKLTGLDWTAMD